MDSCQEKVENLLFTLSTDLQKFVGRERIQRIQNFGENIDTELLAEILYSESGINVFSNKELRWELLTRNTDFFEEISSNNDGNILELINEFNNFKWGDNKRSREFLDLYGLGDYPISFSKTNVKAEEDIDIIKCLYPYQNWVRKKINNFFHDSKKTKLLVQMPTGSGKTRTTMEAVCDHIRQNVNSRITIVWLAHSEELCEQAASSFEEMWSKLGSESAQVIRLWGGNSPKNFKSVMKPTFVVSSFQTAYSMTLTSSDKKFSIFAKIKLNCSLMVVDEAHQSTAPTYKVAIELFSNQNTKIVGLTATPGRHHIGGDESSTEKLVNFYQGNKIGIVDDNGSTLDDPINYLTEKGILSKTNDYSIDHKSNISLTETEITHLESALDIPSSVLKKLGEDVIRSSKIVVSALNQSIKQGRPTIIFAPSKDNAIDLALFIRLQGGNARAIVGETPTADRSQYISDFKDGKLEVLVNFGVLTTGFDAPNIRSVIIARPTSSVVLYSQMLGRGLRGPKMGGSDDCNIIDIHDNIINMPQASQAYTFFDKFYK